LNPHSSQTDEPRTIKIGMSDLGPNLTPFAKVGLDRSIGGGDTKPQFYVISVFSFFPLSLTGLQTNRRTDLMVDDSNDVFSREKVPFGGHVNT
jgi:hypothetical protein